MMILQHSWQEGSTPRQAKGLKRNDGQHGTWTAFFTAHRHRDLSQLQLAFAGRPAVDLVLCASR